MISLIVTTRNRPDFLYRCLLAISKQSDKRFECIVVGDHCNYAERVAKIFGVRFHNYEGRDVTNVGAIGKNIGIQLAKYDRICYCDDDNILMPNHIETMNKTEGDFIVTKFIQSNYGEATAYQMLNRGLYETVNHRLGVSDALTLCHSKKLWREAGMWQPAARIGYNEDGYFMNKLMEKGVKVLVPALTAIYNLHSHTFDEYNKLLPMANPVVYPELIKKYL